MADQQGGGAGVRYRRVDGWTWRRLRGSVVLTRPGAEGHQLDGVAAAVWLGLARPCGRDEVLARLVAAGAPGPHPEDRADLVARGVDALLAGGMIEEQAGAVRGRG